MSALHRPVVGDEAPRELAGAVPGAVVIGGGVVGRSLARALARAGVPVTLVDAGHPAASDVPVALLNPFRGRRGRAHPDDVIALAATWRWADDLSDEGEAPGAHRTGVVRVADGPKQARAFAAAGLEPIDPDLAGVRAPHGAYVVPAGGWVEPAAWLGALRRSATRAGATWLDDTLVVDASPLALEPGWRLRLGSAAAAGAPDGATLSASWVLLATGAAPWPAALDAAVGPEPPFERVAGDVAVTNAPAPRRPLAGSTYVGPVRGPGGDVAAVGGHHRSPGPAAPDAAARLRTAIAWALPTLTGSDTDDVVWSGVRAHPPGRRPVLRVLRPRVLWVGGFAGRGFLAAAAAAEIVATAIYEGRTPDDTGAH